MLELILILGFIVVIVQLSTITKYLKHITDVQLPSLNGNMRLFGFTLTYEKRLKLIEEAEKGVEKGMVYKRTIEGIERELRETTSGGE